MLPKVNWPWASRKAPTKSDSAGTRIKAMAKAKKGTTPSQTPMRRHQLRHGRLAMNAQMLRRMETESA